MWQVLECESVDFSIFSSDNELEERAFWDMNVSAPNIYCCLHILNKNLT